MNFKISKSVFYNYLSIAARAISNYSPLPAFSGIKLDATNDGLILVGSDSDISIKTMILKANEESLKISSLGSIVIESKYIMDIIRKMDSEEIEVEVLENASALIKGENSEIKINGIRSIDYPDLDFSCPKEKVKMKSDALKNIITQTIFATSKSEYRPAITGVNFSCVNNKLRAVGTDSYRLARKEIVLDESLNFNVTIPARNLNEVLKTLDLAEDIEFAVNDKKAQFIIENTVIQTRLIDGAFPDIDRLIPVSFDHELTISASEIIGAIDRASFIKSDGVSIIRLNLSEEECILSSKSQEIGSFKENFKHPVFTGSPLSISFNGQFVFDALRVINKGDVRFKFCGEMKPFIIECVDDESILHLILPLRTYD